VVSNTLENVSPRPWTITGIRLTDEQSARTLPDVRIIGVGLQRQDLPPSASFPGPLLRQLKVSPGEYFTANLEEEQSDCPSQQSNRSINQIERLANSPQNHQHSLPAAITVTTPLGTRTIGMTFSINCDL
jgi:hypothetical protein